MRAGDEISICGTLFHTTNPVILWTDSGGFDAYRPHHHLEPGKKGPREHPDRVQRYDTIRKNLPSDVEARVATRGWVLEDLCKVVDKVVVHFDACGTSQRCFEVLHDIRGLSAHFLIDLDGTIYQTLDVKERAWHAAHLNDRSIGIELANIGAYRDRSLIDEWYARDGSFWVVRPEKIAGLYRTGFEARSATSEIHRATINGSSVQQVDFTEEQYQALEQLLLTLCRVLPRISPTVPRDLSGDVPPEVIDFSTRTPESGAGIIGHYHGSTNKVDPGPAFDWDRIERALRGVDQ